MTKESEEIPENARNVYGRMLGLPQFIAQVINCTRESNKRIEWRLKSGL